MSHLPGADVDVAIVGGGIAGLTAAYDLERAGARTVLCEASDRPGGLVHTEHVEGCVVEAGPDAMLVQKPAALALCHELGLGADLVTTLEPRTAFVLRDGVLHAIPPESVLGLPCSTAAIEACGMLSPEGRATFVRELSTPTAAATEDADESVGAFIRRRLGEEAVRFIAQPLLGGIHAGDVERLSVRALFPMLVEADTHGGSLLAALARRRDGPTADGAFRGLRHGMASLIQRLAALLAPRTLALDARADRVQGGPPFTIETSAGRLRARSLVLAVPAWQTARLLSGLDVDLAHTCATIPYASTATITLAYSRDEVGHPLEGTGFVVPRGESATRLLAASWVTSKWAGRAPDALVLLRAFIGGVLDVDLLELNDAGLSALAHRDLSALLGIRTQPAFSRVYRWMAAGAQYEIGHTSRVATIEEGAARWPGLFLTGSAYRGVGIPDCIADARRTAGHVASLLAI